MARAYIALGTNIGNKRGNIETASALLSQRAGHIVAFSGLYETEPWGFRSPNMFLNLVLALETPEFPDDLLRLSLSIEKEMGRTEKSSGEYKDRIIDIDLLMYDNLVLDTPMLKLPHPLMTERLFVMEPLVEIAPDVIHPVLHIPMKEILERLKRR